MKKLLIIGAIALVVVGCVLAAGCTSTTTNNTTPAATTEDFAVGTWTLPNGTTVVFGENFKGVMTTGDKTFNFTWKKTADGKYQVDREDGAQVIWTLDNVKGTMTNADGAVLTKQTSNTSGWSPFLGREWSSYDESKRKMASTIITLDSNGGTSNGQVKYTFWDRDPEQFTPAKKIDSESGKRYICTGYYTEPEGGDLVLYSDGSLKSTAPGFLNNGKWCYIEESLTLYAHWVDSVQEPELIQLEP